MGIRPKDNVKASLEFNLVNYDVAVQHICSFVTGTPLSKFNRYTSIYSEGIYLDINNGYMWPFLRDLFWLVSLFNEVSTFAGYFNAKAIFGEEQ